MLDFEKSGYPKNMLRNIMEKVKMKKRTLDKREKREPFMKMKQLWLSARFGGTKSSQTF